MATNLVKLVDPEKHAQYLERVRSKIRGSQLLTRLVTYTELAPEEAANFMSPEQVRTSLALLRKVAPDIAAQTITVRHDDAAPPTREMNLDELMREWEKRTKLVSDQ